jgi:WD40 repeat protein
MRIGAVVLLVLLPSLADGRDPIYLGEAGFRIGQRYQEAVLSPDGRYFALGGEYADVFLLDAASGRILQHWEPELRPTGLAFGPDNSLLILDEGGWVRTYDPVSGRLRREILLYPAHGSPVQGRLFAGGRLVAFRAEREEPGGVVLFDQRTGLALARDTTLAPNLLRGSPSGRFVLDARPAQGREGLVLVVFDLDAGRTWNFSLRLPVQTNRQTTNWQGIAIDEQARVAVAVGEGRVLRAHLASGKIDKVVLKDMDESWHSAEIIFSPDARRVVFRDHKTGEKNFAEWDLVTGQRLQLRSAPPLMTDRSEWTSTGRLLAWASQGRRLQPWDLGSTQPTVVDWSAPASVDWSAPASPAGPGGDVLALRFAGQELVSVDGNGRVSYWDTNSGRRVREWSLPDGQFPVGFDERGRLRLAAPQGTLASYDLEKREARSLESFPAGTSWTPLSSDSRWWGDPRLSQLFDLDTGRSLSIPEEVRAWLDPSQPGIRWAVAAGKRIALGMRSTVPDMNGNTRFQVAILSAPGPLNRWDVPVVDVTPPVFSPDGVLLALCHDDNLSLFEVGQQPQDMPFPGALWAISFSPDGRHLLVEATGEQGNELCLVELATQTIRQRWLARGLLGFRAVFSPDGQLLAIPVVDGTILLVPVDLAPPPRLDPATLWSDLGSPDSAVAHVAMQALAARPNARKEIAGRRHLLEPPPEEIVDPLPLLPDLDSDEVAIREAAQRRLRHVPRATLDSLRTSRTDLSPEVRRALQNAIEFHDQIPEPDSVTLRRQRVAEVLERLLPSPR